MLNATDITVKVGNTTLVSGASLALKPGVLTVIIGPNGAGKSTLLSAAAGMRRPHSGQVLLGGENLLRMPAKMAARRRAVMPQNSTVAFPFTVRDVVMMGRTPWGRSARDEQIVQEVLTINELTEFSHRVVPTLSGGERQRVAFARVMAQAFPAAGQVIMCDEPTAAMDIAHAEHTLELMRGLAHQGAAVGAVLHDLDAAACYADELVLMHKGRVRAVGSVAQVCDAELLSQVYGTPIEVRADQGRVRVGPRR